MTFDLADLGPLAGSLVKAGLPALGTLLGAVLPPPFDFIAGGAFKLIATAMGIDPAAPAAPAAVQTAIEADPAAAAAKLQAIEADHKVAADAATEQLRLQLADIQSARGTTLALAQAGSPIAWGAPVVSAVVTAGFVTIVMVMTIHAIPDSAVVNVLVGTLATAFGSVVNYWLGSSAGSHAKTQLLAAAAPAAPATKRIGR